MAHRPMNPRPQKEGNRRFSAQYRNQPSNSHRSHRSPPSPSSPSYHRAQVRHSQQSSPISHEPNHPTMPIPISAALRRWLMEKRLDGYIRVAEAPPHPDALDIARKLNIDTVTNTSIRKNLDLPSPGERHFEIPPTETLQRYFGPYSASAKAYRTKEIPDPFFREIAKFLLEVGCVHVNAYGMPKQKASIIIDTFEGRAIYWGVITEPTLREGLHAYQGGKKLRPIIQQYLMILFPP